MDPGNITIGSIRGIQCLPGYANLGGEPDIRCQPDQTWTTWSGTCEKCPSPPSVSHATISAGDTLVGTMRTYSCNAGYVDNEVPGNITCEANAQWSTTLFACRSCSTPGSIPNTVLSQGGVLVGTQRTYSCDTGYASNGESGVITCQANATWSETSIMCSACDEPGPIANANLNSGQTLVGTQRTYTCATGYASNGNSGVITCQSDITWSATSFGCITCPEPDPIADASISSGSVLVGSQRTYSCNTGYADNGQSGHVTCQSDATWSSTSFACSTCTEPSAIQNAVVSAGDVTVGAQRTYTCDSGYGSSSSSATITCESDATWSSTSFVCSTCTAPAQISNTAVSSGGVTVGSQRTYTCNSGYNDNGQSGLITCQSDATWSSTSFACIIDCGQPNTISNAQLNSGGTESGSQRSYTCNSGYTSNGQTSTITCQSSGQWTSTSFACNIDCGSPSSISYAQISSGGTTLNSQRTYTCNSGYTGNGQSNTVTCLSNGAWSSTSFACLKDCGQPSAKSYASVSSGGTTAGSQRTYSCNSGYTGNGYSSTITCQSSGSWSSTSFACSGRSRISQ